MKEKFLKKDFFDDCSKDWEALKPCKYDLIKEKITPLLELKKGEKVLDACCGTGILTPVLKEFRVLIAGIDYS
ncbi:MAG: class I SAM-dependent methyltransferase, partial [Endomicrobia bacterium]|nr:class I SAM-dependent methyltransferase [Endomicrobiia bacterium]